MNLLMRLMLASIIVALGACATTGGNPSRNAASDEDVIGARALERWEHLIAKRPAQAWDYLSPGYRTTVSRDEYSEEILKRRVRWTRVELFKPLADSSGAEVDAAPAEPSRPIECSEEGLACTIHLRVHYSIRSHLHGVGVIDSTNGVQERWIKVKGQWYFVPPEVAR